jgi:hypothetical protein
MQGNIMERDMLSAVQFIPIAEKQHENNQPSSDTNVWAQD